MAKQRNNGRPRPKVESETPTVEPLVMRCRRERVVAWVFRASVTTIIVLWLGDVFINYAKMSEHGQIRRMFNGTREDGLLSFAMLVTTLLTALSAWGVFAIVRRQGASWVRWGAWLVIAAMFSYMAADDAATIHERLGSVFKTMSKPDPNAEPGLGKKLLDFFPSYPWQVLFMPVFGLFGLFMLVFLWRELRDSVGRMLVIAAIAVFALSVVLDFFEGMEFSDENNPYANIARTDAEFAEWTEETFDRKPYAVIVHFSKVAEEGLEMFGMTLLLMAFLRHGMRTAPAIDLRFDDGSGTDGPAR